MVVLCTMHLHFSSRKQKVSLATVAMQGCNPSSRCTGNCCRIDPLQPSSKGPPRFPWPVGVRSLARGLRCLDD